MKYTETTGKKIVTKFSQGMTIQELMSSGDCPTRAELREWRRLYKSFDVAMTDAVEDHVDSLADKALQEIKTNSNTRQSKLISEQLRWYCSKLNRSKYGDKLEIAQTVQVDITPLLADAMSRVNTMGLDVPLIEAKAVNVT